MSIDQSVQVSQYQNYTYPEFLIDERSGNVAVNLIDKASGKVMRHIPSIELNKILQNTASQTGEHVVT